jgi:subtilisin family serine protease
LKRINVKILPLPSDYKRRISSAAPVHVIIIDSGIDASHPDLKSRVANSSEHFSFVQDDDCCESQNDPLCDCAQQGTHSSGLVASPHSGYNPSAILHSIKIFDEMGSTNSSVVLQGMNKAIDLAALHPGEAYIASISVSAVKSGQTNLAAEKMVKAGIFLVAPAGNYLIDACRFSPASSPAAFTVGASDIDDSIAYLSCTGSCVDIFAPGVEINSCKSGGGYQYMSGTVTSTHIVAGFASAIAGVEGLTSPSDIRAAVNRHITKNVVTNAKSINNNLPYDGRDNTLLSFLQR